MEQNVAKTNENVVTGRRFRRLIDEKTNTWERISGWMIVTDRPFKKAIPVDSEKIQKEN